MPYIFRPQHLTPSFEAGRRKARLLFRTKNSRRPRKPHIIASQKATDGEDPLKTGMNKGETGKHGFPAAGFQRVCRPHPLALGVARGVGDVPCRQS